MIKRKLTHLMPAMIIMGVFGEANSAIIYVNARSQGGNGMSWDHAFNNLDSALNSAKVQNTFTQIWVAKGTYKPTVLDSEGYDGSENNRITFKLPNNVGIYGGFSGNETLLSQRKPGKNPTILSGDINGNDFNIPHSYLNKSDNAWHILTADGVTGVILDGLIVQNGYAAGPDSGTFLSKTLPNNKVLSVDYAHNAGAGLFARHGAKVTLNNMQFNNNVADSSRATMFTTNPAAPVLAGGGAIAAIDPKTIVTIHDSVFTNNSAYSPAPFAGANGGALNALLNASFIVSGSQFIGNLADRAGGAIHLKNSADTFIDSTIFTSNRIVGLIVGDERGGAIAAYDNSLKVTNSTFNTNYAFSSPSGAGGAIFYQVPTDSSGTPKLEINNSTFTGNLGSSFGGGALFIFGSKVKPNVNAKILNSVFTNNISGIGGAIYADSLPTSVQNCSFNANKAWYVGGAILGSNFADAIHDVIALNARSLLDISNSVFSENYIIGTPADKHAPVFIYDKYAQHLTANSTLIPASVSFISPGGGAVASEFGGNVNIANSAFNGNVTVYGNGGALLVGGTQGRAGTTKFAMNQGFMNINLSSCHGNINPYGYINHSATIDPYKLGSNSNGVQFVTDGSCSLDSEFKMSALGIKEKIKALDKLREQSIKESAQNTLK
ncbi:MAG: hypothetical protein H0U70_05590 [Tatlockia sp.]|nr:hypothetical protein [Tatlockia sp.]